MDNRGKLRDPATTRFLTWIDSVRQDVTFGLRLLRRSPIIGIASVLSLALAVGACLAAANIVDAVFLRKLPVRNSESLFQVIRNDLHSTGESFSYPVFSTLRDHSRATADLFLASFVRIGWVRWDGGDGSEERVEFQHVSGNFFEALGAGAAPGRVLTKNDDKIPGAHPVAVISENYWARRFGRSRSVLGRRMEIDGRQFEVVGVTSAGFFGVEVGRMVDVWFPATMWESRALTDTGVSWLRILGRRTNGATLAQAEAQLQSAYRVIQADGDQNPSFQMAVEADSSRTPGLRLLPAENGVSHLRSQYDRPLRIILGIVILVLLIACANITNLLLAKGAARGREMAVRLAVGIGRARLLRQLLTEYLLLGSAACLVGVLAALQGTPLLVNLLARDRQPVRIELGLNWRVAIAAIAACLFTTLLFGLWPALKACRTTIDASLRGGHGETRSSAGGWRNGKFLVVSQVALCLVLLANSMLLLATLHNFSTLDPGFDRNNVVVVELMNAARSSPQQQRGLWREVGQRLSEVPGVKQVASSNWALFTGAMAVEDAIRIFDQPVPTKSKESYSLPVSPGYFSTVGTRLLRGRAFEQRDADPDGPKIAVVNQAFVKMHLNGESPLGKRFRIESSNSGWTEIVGVVENVKYHNLRDEPPALIYYPMRNPHRWTTMFVRTEVSANALASLIRPKVRSVSPAIRIERITPYNNLIDQTLIRERLLGNISTVFAVVALILSAVGLFGVTYYSVSQRTRELGIRLAVGAQQRTILAMVMRQSMAPVLLGAVLGIALVIPSSQLIRSLLFGLKPADPVFIALAVLALLGVAVVASYLPARLASRIDPLVALRQE